MRAPSLGTLLPLFYSSAAAEVEFNCPWCNTRLALPRNDFANERAVLCPRCNNPIDLDIQRRLTKTAPARASTPVAPSPPEQQRRRVTTPPPSPPAPAYQPSPSYQAPPSYQPPLSSQASPSPPSRGSTASPDLSSQNAAALGSPMHAPAPIRTSDIDVAFGSDATRLGDVDALTGGRSAPRSTMPEANSSQSTPSSKTGMGSKLKCPSCGYENSSVPPEFSFGTEQKCAWCGKPLPK